MPCPAGWGPGSEVDRVQLEALRSSASRDTDPGQSDFSDAALDWFMPLRSRPPLYFISVVNHAPSCHEMILPVPAVSLGRGIFMKVEEAAPST